MQAGCLARTCMQAFSLLRLLLESSQQHVPLCGSEISLLIKGAHPSLRQDLLGAMRHCTEYAGTCGTLPRCQSKHQGTPIEMLSR